MSFNNPTRSLILSGIAEIPEAGGFLAALTGILWPEQPTDVWDDIKDKVETLVEKDISKSTYKIDKNWLLGVKNNIDSYSTTVQDKSSTAEDIRREFTEALGSVQQFQPSLLNDTTNAILLAPLIAQYANLHLGLLRDAVHYGLSWGMSSSEVEGYYSGVQGLQAEIKMYCDWVATNIPAYEPVLEWAHAEVPFGGYEGKVPTSWAKNNDVARFMVMSVQDIAHYWPFFDIRKHPSGKVAAPGREIYFGPLSANQTFGKGKVIRAKIESAVGKKRLTALRVFGHDRVDSVQNCYGIQQWGPRLGVPYKKGSRSDTNGGSAEPPYGFDIPLDSPIVSVSGGYGSTSGSLCTQSLNTLRVTHKDGTMTPELKYYELATKFACSAQDHILSQIYSAGSLDEYSGPDEVKGCGAAFVVLGFRYEDSY